MSEKIFVGKMETLEMNGKNGPWKKTTISFNEKDLAKLNENKNANGYVKILVQRRKSDNKIYLEIDPYVPTQGQSYSGDDSF